MWESSGYKIFVNADHTSGERIDLPGDLIHLTHYCATLGHKMNHSFDYNCEEWSVYTVIVMNSDNLAQVC